MKQRNDLTFYDRSADEWWNPTSKVYTLSYLNPARFSYFDRFISNWRGLNVLDVGCGGGFTCEFLASRGAIAAGVDQSLACIKAARRHAQRSKLAIDYQHGFSEALPYSNSAFDVVVCVDVLEHVDDLSTTLSEIYRVLKPGGLFCFDTINRTLKSKLIMIWLLEGLLCQIPKGIHDWEKFISPEMLNYYFEKIGFCNTAIKGFNVVGSNFVENLQSLAYYLKTKKLRISINDDLSVMFIGVTQK